MTYPDFVSENLGWRPVNRRFILIHTINHDGTASSHIVDTFLSQLLHASRLNNDVEAIRVVLLQLLPLGSRILSVELNVLVCCIQLLGNVHLDTFVRGNDDSVRSVELQQLSQDEASRPSAKQKNINANWGIEFVKTVNGACGRLKKRGFLICQIVDLIAFLLMAEAWSMGNVSRNR